METESHMNVFCDMCSSGTNRGSREHLRHKAEQVKGHKLYKVLWSTQEEKLYLLGKGYIKVTFQGGQ